MPFSFLLRFSPLRSLALRMEHVCDSLWFLVLDLGFFGSPRESRIFLGGSRWEQSSIEGGYRMDGWMRGFARFRRGWRGAGCRWHEASRREQVFPIKNEYDVSLFSHTKSEIPSQRLAHAPSISKSCLFFFRANALLKSLVFFLLLYLSTTSDLSHNLSLSSSSSVLSFSWTHGISKRPVHCVPQLSIWRPSIQLSWSSLLFLGNT